MWPTCLVLFQFTLYSVLKGNKPDFHQAMGGDESQAFYSNFVSALKAAYQPERVKGKSASVFLCFVCMCIEAAKLRGFCVPVNPRF